MKESFCGSGYVSGWILVVITALFLGILYIVWREMRKKNSQLKKLAYFDSLTELYNIGYFTELAYREVMRDSEYALAVVNVRQFKFINEIFGKEQADQLLRYIGKILSESVRGGEFACRESADFFYLFLRETDQKKLEMRLRKVLDRIMSMDGKLETPSYRLLLRCGVAVAEEGHDLQGIMTHAMFALARLKENRQRDLCFFNSRLHESEQTDNYMERHAYEALEQGQFKLYLQPEINLKDNSLAGAEALARWVEPDGTILYPGAFIPVFEANGFCVELDLYMFRSVCRKIREWIDAGIDPVPVSINQSKLTFYQVDYIEKLKEELNTYQIPASLITLEVLESMSVDNPEELNVRLDELKKIGFHISLDDFGSGYSSLNTLANLKIDEVKLDRGFLLKATKDGSKNTRLIMEAIVRLSRELSITTVIEGIETEEDEAFVKAIGGEKGQGYLYSRPVSAKDFTREIFEKHTKKNALQSNCDQVQNIF